MVAGASVVDPASKPVIELLRGLPGQFESTARRCSHAWSVGPPAGLVPSRLEAEIYLMAWVDEVLVGAFF